MNEQISREEMEAEIAALTLVIKEKRALLEQKSNIETEQTTEGEKSIVREAVAERVAKASPAESQAYVANKLKSSAGKTAKHYLDNLSEGDKENLRTVLETVFRKGLKAGVAQVLAYGDENPLMVDAFHDALTDKYYEDLRNRKIVK